MRMKNFTTAITFFLAVIAPLIIVTVALREPSPDQHTLEQLREQYVIDHQPGVDHSKMEILQQDFKNPHEITAACLSCHTERGHDLLESAPFK